MQPLTLRAALDIALVSLGLWILLSWLRRTQAGAVVLLGPALVVGYVAAREARLDLSAWMLRGAFAAFLIVLIVVLQDDLRRLFRRLRRLRLGRRSRHRGTDTTDRLCGAVFDLARQRRGALVVLPGREPLDGVVEGGVRLDGRLTEPLLLSLFDPGSVGHDGAAIVEDGVVTSFAVHLPLSTNFAEIQRRGTRHSAALGISEATDALVIAVSEERGEVSVALEGHLTRIESQDALRAEIEGWPDGGFSPPTRPSPLRFLRQTWRDAVVAVVLSMGLWQLFVAGSKVTLRTLHVPVLVDNIDPGVAVEAIEPGDVEVEVAGLARDVFLLDASSFEVRLDASLAALGRRTFRLTADNVRHPPDITVRSISPDVVRLRVTTPEPDAFLHGGAASGNVAGREWISYAGKKNMAGPDRAPRSTLPWQPPGLALNLHSSLPGGAR